MTGFWAGLLHPLLVPTHTMALLVLALLISRQGCEYRAGVVFALAVVAGLVGIALAYVPSAAGEGLLVASAAAGLLVALDRPLPPWLGTLLAGASGLALALDSPPEAISLRQANLMLLGTAIGATGALIGLLQVTSRLTQGWSRVGARILGSWIAASAALVLTLVLVR